MFHLCGRQRAIDLAFRATLEEGDEVIIPPALLCVLRAVRQNGRGVPVTIALKEENAFRLQPEELEAAITPPHQGAVHFLSKQSHRRHYGKRGSGKLVPIILEHDLR